MKDCRHEFSHCSECCDAEHQATHVKIAALRLLNEHLREALTWIMAEPYGCVFCDSGKLRNPKREHSERCGFAKAADLLGAMVDACGKE